MLWAQVPVREEQFVYSVLAFNGKDYSGTFARADADAIYVLADTDSFLTARKTFVYYWPITEKWMTDTGALNVPLGGWLQLKARRDPWGEASTIALTAYTYYNVRGKYELNWRVEKGPEAARARQRYERMIEGYWGSMQEYYDKKSAYDQELNRLTAAINQTRKEGRDDTELVDALKELKAPAEPEYPTDYVVPPAPVQMAFILNLPAGEYHIRMVSKEGEIMEGSERDVIVFDKRRSEGLGLDVIPSDKWTRPEESKTPASVLYVDGSADLYLRPFYQQEYNDLYYEKLLRNDARGNPNLMKWVRIQQVPDASIELTRPNGPDSVLTERPYFVEQLPGDTLGYRIVPFDPEGEHAGREPSLRAFHIPLSAAPQTLRLRVLDESGEFIAGGNREIRVVDTSRLSLVPLFVALLPLLAIGAVLLRRSRTYAR